MGKRDIAMLAFLADTGCRAGGMLALAPENLDLDRGRAILREKRGKNARLYPSPDLQPNYCADGLSAPAGSPTLFCSMRFKDYAQPLTVSGLNQIIRRLKQRVVFRVAAILIVSVMDLPEPTWKTAGTWRPWLSLWAIPM